MPPIFAGLFVEFVFVIKSLLYPPSESFEKTVLAPSGSCSSDFTDGASPFAIISRQIFGDFITSVSEIKGDWSRKGFWHFAAG